MPVAPEIWCVSRSFLKKGAAIIGALNNVASNVASKGGYSV